MANILGGKIPPVPGSARRLNYKVRLASDLSVGEGGQRGYHSKRKYCTIKKNKREKQNPSKFILRKSVFFRKCHSENIQGSWSKRAQWTSQNLIKTNFSFDSSFTECLTPPVTREKLKIYTGGHRHTFAPTHIASSRSCLLPPAPSPQTLRDPRKP